MAKKNAYYERIQPRLKEIEHWLTEGYSHAQIYKMLGVSVATFYKYFDSARKEFYKEEFAKVMESGKKGLQIKLEEALYKEAMGYEYTETHTEVETDETGDEKNKDGSIRTKIKKKQKKVTKFARPNSNLLIFALCNKFPEKWRRIDKDVVEAIENNNVNLNITDKHIKDAFSALYPAIKEKSGDNDKNKDKDKKEK